MSHDIFISHKTEDKDVASAVCKKLEASGIKCWLAARDQIPGGDYAEQIERAVVESCVTVFVFSKYCNEDPRFVKRELESAVKNGSDITVLRLDEVRHIPLSACS